MPDHAPAVAQFSPTPDVLIATMGAVGIITLNRPRAINALTLDMVHAIHAALDRWAPDDSIASVVLRGAGERGLCAGGDVRRQRELALGGPEDHARALQFWHDEYNLDYAIAQFGRPVVAFIHGVTMGGGIGLAGYATTRLITPGALVAMPEMAIGFFPDVGATHLLAAAPGQIGTHLALTGQAIGPAEAIYVGLADALVETDLDTLIDRLAEGDTSWTGDPIGAGVGTAPTATALEQARTWIDPCYAGNDPVAILDRLRTQPHTPGAGTITDPAHAANLLATGSPLTVHIALAALRQAGNLGDLRAVLDRDDALAAWFTDQPDFHEGVRAQLVDKDRQPRWQYPDLASVPPERIQDAFAKYSSGLPG